MFQKILKNKWEVTTITIICLIALFLNIWRISIQGYANEYYTAGAMSMTQSWKNFFFVAYDPAGYVSIDKPPLGLWLQAISVKIFGVSGFSVLLPEIIGGVVSIFLLYKILKKAVSWKIAALGAFFLAITPIFVVTARTNTPDMVMIPLLLWALFVTITAIEKQKMRYLIGVGVIIGLAFNVKMLQAYMVVPATFGAYLLFTNIRIWKRLRNVLIAVIVMVSVSLSWAIVVDATPKTDRPYVGSTTSNSAMELIFGWNGISRVTSTGDTPNTKNEEKPSLNQAASEVSRANVEETSNDSQSAPQGSEGPTPPSGERRGQGDTMTPGTPGVTRLLQKGLGEQVSWFLGLAISGFFLVLFKRKKIEAPLLESETEEGASAEMKDVIINRLSQLSAKKQQAILWMLWLLPASFYFSFSTGLFHTYYLAMIAAPLAALAAIGLGVVFFSNPVKHPWVVRIGLAATVCNSFLQSLYHSYYGDWEGWMVVFIPLITIGGVIGYIVFLKLKKHAIIKRLSIIIIIVGITIAPFAWSLVPMLYGEDAVLAQATPSTSIATTRQSRSSEDTNNLASYLVANQGDATYLVAAQSSQEVSNIIIVTGKPAMAIGGFSGSDKTITLNEFKEFVKVGRIQYYLGGEQARGNSDEIVSWIKANSTIISAREYGATETTSQMQTKEQIGPSGQKSILYKINKNAV